MNILINAIIICFVISTLFVLARVYFVYFAKPNCSDDCKCETLKDARIREMYLGEDEVKSPTNTEKTKRTRKPKATVATEGSVKKKPGRKKKS